VPVLSYRGVSPEVAEGVFVAPTAYVVGRVTVGPECSLWFGTTIRGDTNTVTLGRGVNVQECSTVHSQAESVTVVGNRVTMGHHSLIHAALVDDDVLLGSNASVLTGAHVGAESIIAPHALIVEGAEIPPRSLVIGVPGKVVRELTDKDLARIYKNAQTYIGLAGDYLNELART
jgi:carbonic anhydrase/acetyltransferase-like protein (isoleucine patch superfamily)